MYVTSHSRWLLLVLLLAIPAAVAGREPPDETLPSGAVIRLGSTRLRPVAPAQGIAFSPDGKTLASTGGPFIQLWDTATGRERRRLKLSVGAVFASRPGFLPACFTAEGRVLVVADTTGVLHLLDVATGNETATVMAGTGGICDVSMSADGKLLAAAAISGTAFLWEMPAGRLRHKLPGAPGRGRAVLTPDGKYLVATGRDNRAHVIDCATGKDVRTLGDGRAPGAGPAPAEGAPPWRGVRPGVVRLPVQTLAVSADGRLAAMSGWGGPVTVCALATGQTVATLEQSGGSVQALAFSPNGRFLAAGLYPGARIYGLASGAELRQLECTTPTLCRAVEFSPDGKTLAGLAQDGSIHLWDVAASRELHPARGHTGNVQALAFLGGGRLVSGGNDGRLVAWDLATGRALGQAHGQPVQNGQLTPTADGTGVQALGYDHQLHLWRPGSPPEVRRIDLPGHQFFLMAVSPDGRRVAAVHPTDHKLRLYEPGGKDPDGRVLSLPEGVLPNRLIFAPDGGRLVAQTGDGIIHIWDCATGREIRIGGDTTMGMRWPWLLTFAPDGRTLLVLDAEVWIAEIVSGQRRARLVLPPGQATAMAWSPDGRLVASAHADGRVRLFVAATGEEVTARPRGEKGGAPGEDPSESLHDERVGQVQSLAFSPDGRLLACGGSTGLIILWQVPAPPAPAALSPERRSALWADLATPDAVAAGRAVAALAAAPGSAVELLRQHLRPGETRIDPRHLEKLVADLDSDEFVVREQAQRELAAAGAAAVDVLRQALAKDPSAEVRRRLQRLLAPFDRADAPPARLRGVRAVEVLERIGTPQARELLQALAGKMGDAVIEQEIQDSLRRLAHRK
jgi:YD repeat-containing protein